MSESEWHSELPRSLRHQQILDIASSQPDASIEEIATTISGIGPDLVEEVLDKYGDPSDDQTETESTHVDRSDDEERTTPSIDDLTEKQIEILHAIQQHPEAKQRELAKILDIAAPTACNRANSIPGFAWDERKDFADAVLEGELRSSSRDPPIMTNDISDPDEKIRIEDLIERIESIEEKIEDLVALDRSYPTFDDMDLALKVVHASIKSEAITEDEELRILQRILG